MEISDPGAIAGRELAAFTIAAVLVTGTGAPMVKTAAFDAITPGVDTVTLTRPGAASRMAGTPACKSEPPVNVVASGEPFHSTVEVARKFDPTIASVRPGAPAAAEAGLMLSIEGTGVVTAKAAAFDSRPLGFAKVIAAEPGVAIRS